MVFPPFGPVAAAAIRMLSDMAEHVVSRMTTQAGKITASEIRTPLR